MSIIALSHALTDLDGSPATGHLTTRRLGMNRDPAPTFCSKQSPFLFAGLNAETCLNEIPKSQSFSEFVELDVK